MRRFTIALTLIAAASGPAWAGFEKEDGQRYWRSLWPKGVDIPRGLKFYSLPRASQYLVIMNEADYNGIHSWDYRGADPGQANPNQVFPYAVPGGMHEVQRSRWFNGFGISIPRETEVAYWMERVPVPFAERLLPQLRWSYPVGTTTVDLLCSTDGREAWPFELRIRRKLTTGWDSRVEWRAPEENRPPGYRGHKSSGKTCSECHQQAGASENYGVSIRGSDTVFSYYPFTEDSISPGHGYRQVWIDSKMLRGWADSD